MQVANLFIKNFRGISEISIPFYSITSLIGANNCGKSTVFKAMELFFDAGARVSEDDFHRKDTNSPIVIRITFENLTRDEYNEYESAVSDGRLVISREFSLQEPHSPNYTVSARIFPPFSEIRGTSAASEKTSLYRAIQREYGLPPIRSAADADSAIAEWEASNPDKLETQSIRGFFGATNVANGKIKKKTSLRLIPAVRDTADDAKAGRKSPVLDLLADITKQTFENRAELKEELASAAKRISELTDPDTIPELAKIGESISEIVRNYYSDSSVFANWDKVEPITVNYPRPKISVKNRNIVTDIDLVGNGLQRVILFSLVQFMAERTSANPDSDDFTEPQSDIVLLVEEPEIFQHPIKQEILYRNFGRIVTTFNATSGIRFQIIFATHSEKFVRMKDFEICRVMRKHVGEADVTTNSVGFARLADCVRDFAQYHEPPIQPMAEEAFAAKLHIFSREICEGFFADKVVLVEGASDKPVLEAYYESIGRDSRLEGIQIIPVGGKNSMQKPAYIFMRVGIPTYLIFDNDDAKGQERKTQGIIENRFLQKIACADEIQDMPSGAKKKFYAHSGNLESYLRGVIGAQAYNQQFHRLATDWGMPVEAISKTPDAFSSIIRAAILGGYEFDALRSIVAAVDAL